ncbi:MAG: cbb3-type cytochrome oxidase assembly protein CcoS [Alphaproteobacteria bacterium]|nr:cbb3-type cytochrome oxidase assembly protein CcoS [Alphaproteobacteria bacterium]
MTGLLVLIPIALGLGILGLLGFLWAMRRGQFEDLDGATARILFEPDGPADPGTARERDDPPPP